MFKLLARINAGLAVISAAIMLFMSFSISYSVITRALHIRSPLWVVQVSEYAMVWITFLATAWVLSQDGHITVDIIYSRVNEKLKRALRLLQNVVCTLLCMGLCYFSAQTTWEHYAENIIDVQSIDVPKALVLWVIPVGFFLLSLQFIVKILKDYGIEDSSAESVDSERIEG